MLDRFDPKNRDLGAVKRALIKFSDVQAVLFSMASHFAVSSPQIIRRRSNAVALEAENRNGIPKLDSAGMGWRFELTKAGAAAQVLHRARPFEAAFTMLSRGVERSLESASVVPS